MNRRKPYLEFLSTRTRKRFEAKIDYRPSSRRPEDILREKQLCPESCDHLQANVRVTCLLYVIFIIYIGYYR